MKLMTRLALLAMTMLAAQLPAETTTQVGAEILGGAVDAIIIDIDPATLPPVKQWQPGDPIKEIPMQQEKIHNPPQREPRGFGLDPLLYRQLEVTRNSLGGDAEFGNLLINQAGLGFSGASPSDSVGDVGNEYYIQMTNSAFGAGSIKVLVLDKTDGTRAIPPFNLADLAAGSGSNCANGIGDPIINFDETADNGPGNLPGRWVLSEMNIQSFCVYVSQTSDPTSGQWFLYEFASATGILPDYPKYGVWPDAYYIGANEGPRQYALDRINMLAGNTARAPQVFEGTGLPGFGFQHIMPVDWDGDIAPPAGSPGLFMRHRDTEIHGPGALPNSDIIEMFEFVADFDNPGNSTFTGPINITVNDFDSEFCDLAFTGCLTQPNSDTTLFALLQPIMWRAQYRNFGDRQSIVANMVTDVTGTDIGGVRWFELTNSGSGWSLNQDGTVSEDDGISRWMASVAQDETGNIVAGYNVVGVGDPGTADDVFPGMRYNGRSIVDPVGTMPQGEVSIIEGSAPNGSVRYGDYTSLNVDPVDGCTFWFTAQHNQSGQWSTQIGSFRFDACGEPDFTLSASNAQQQICIPDDLQDVTVNVGSINDFVNPVTLSLQAPPTGVSGSFSVNPVIPGNASVGSISIDNTAATGDNLITVLGTATGADDRTTTVLAEVFDTLPDALLLQAPADGEPGVASAPLLSWNGVAQTADYLVEIATDPAFANIVYQANEANTSHQVTDALALLTTHFWRVTANNPCGAGAASAAFSFTTRDLPPVLLVDDDDNAPDVQQIYADALNALGIQFDLFDTGNSDNEPGAEMNAYDAVIWFTGEEFGGAAGPGATSETTLASYLDGGDKCLLLSSQDYISDRGQTDFMADYLGFSNAVSDDGDYSSVTGAGDLSGLAPYTLNYGAAGLTDFSDILTVAGDGQVLLEGNNGNDAAAGNASFNTLFTSFPLAAIGSATEREELLLAFFDNICQSFLLDEVFFSDGFETPEL